MKCGDAENGHDELQSTSQWL